MSEPVLKKVEGPSTGALEGSDQGQMPASLQFLNYVGKLKHLKRTGWIRKNIPEPESVAGHMYRMAIMSGFMVDDPSLDINRCMKISLVHDIGESIIGDITPHCGVSDKEKEQIEAAAIEKLASLLCPMSGDELRQLFEEYENGTTQEGRLVKDLDKFDMVMQAYEYEVQEGRGKFLQEFFDSTKTFFHREDCHPKVKALVQDLYQAREKGIPFSSSSTN